MRKRDYADYDLLIGMDQVNIRNLRQICGGDPDGKIHLLLNMRETWDRRWPIPGIPGISRPPGRMFWRDAEGYSGGRRELGNG